MPESKTTLLPILGSIPGFAGVTGGSRLRLARLQRLMPGLGLGR